MSITTTCFIDVPTWSIKNIIIFSIRLDDAPKKIIKPTRKENVIRYPKGPDGTKGFNVNVGLSLN